MCLTTWAEPNVLVLAVTTLENGCGLLLLLGFLTPAAAMLATLISFGAVLGLSAPSLAGSTTASLFATAIAVSLACLGPGAFSLDARRYGRREIVIPQRHIPHSED